MKSKAPSDASVAGQDEGGPFPRHADWLGPDSPNGAYVRKERQSSLQAYRSQPNLIIEHANLEEDTARGGYADRQLFELVQNSADSIVRVCTGVTSRGGRISIRLTQTHLYCADEGQAIDQEGIRALMFSHLSPKRETEEIGRFGLGFKSVLAVTDTPEFFSRSGSFRFDKAKSARSIRHISPDTERYPVLRLPEAIDPWGEAEADSILYRLMGWAKNIVRLQLKPGAHETLRSQITNFPPEFLLFARHVSELTLDNREYARRVCLNREDDLYILDDGESTTRWMMVSIEHRLSSDAKSDSRSPDDVDVVPIDWAAPVDRLNKPGLFWASFPTMTTSLLSGILNAPWKTNEDRKNLLSGVYNDELIDAAADMVAEALPRLSTWKDRARHLDALPRREEAGDTEHSVRLRHRLYEKLQDSAVVPDQDGTLWVLSKISCPPHKMTDDALDR